MYEVATKAKQHKMRTKKNYISYRIDKNYIIIPNNKKEHLFQWHKSRMYAFDMYKLIYENPTKRDYKTKAL